MTEQSNACEKANGPDRALDWEIHLRNGLWGVGMYGSHPAYTGSVDAALTLVPEGCFARIYCEAHQCIIVAWTDNIGWEEVARSDLCSNYALAICAAALRANGTKTND